MPAPRKYPDELRDRAQRLVAEAMSEDPSLSLNAAVKRIAPKVGVVPDTLRGWVRLAEIDEGRRPGTTSSDAASPRASTRAEEPSGTDAPITYISSPSSRGSSTLDCRGERVHRRPPREVGGRADLQGAHRARLPDRPEHVLRRSFPRPVGPGRP